MVVSRTRVDDAVAFGDERDGTDGRPVSGVAGPARRIEFAGLDAQRMSGRQNRVILACMALRRAEVTNAAVTMIKVVPRHEAGGPGAGLLKAGKPLGGTLRAVLGRAEPRSSVPAPSPNSRATTSAAAVCGGNNQATALSLNACRYRAFLHPYRPQILDCMEATTILTRGRQVEQRVALLHRSRRVLIRHGYDAPGFLGFVRLHCPVSSSR